MDKRSLLGMVTMVVVVIAWMVYNQMTYKPPKKDAKTLDSLSKKTEQAVSDSIAKQADSVRKATETAQQVPDSTQQVSKFGTDFASVSKGNERLITVENDLLIAKISSKGGAIKYWQLKNFKKWDKVPTQLIWYNKGELFQSFVTYEGKKINTSDLFFNVSGIDKDSVRIGGNDSLTLTFSLEPTPGKKIIRQMKFFGDKYIFDLDLKLENMDNIIPNRGYNLAWADGMRFQEQNSVDEANEAKALVQLNGSVTDLNADKDEPKDASETGVIDYAALKIKYFGAAIIPQPFQSFDGTVDLRGERFHMKNKGMLEKYDLSYRIPYKGGVQEDHFRVFIGPLDYDIVKQYGLEAMVNFGWKYGIRQIGEYFMLPIFRFIHSFVPNYGISILIFSLLMKLLLYPLSIQQMRSARKMQLIQPEMEKVREKFKDDQAKQQQETLRLYSEYGINPAGGCLPMLLQMPILIALWQVLRSAIELRQANFVWWIHDLSTPDILVNFGFSFLGITHLSGLALLMGVTMFFQQKMTVTDPRQKSLVYMMPIMFTLMFSNFPSGLNLYYFMFNLFGIAQQLYINKLSPKKLTLADLRKAPKKEGWLQRKMREAQEIAEAQGRTVPGGGAKKPNTNGSGNRTPNQQQKKKKK